MGWPFRREKSYEELEAEVDARLAVADRAEAEKKKKQAAEQERFEQPKEPEKRRGFFRRKPKDGKPSKKELKRLEEQKNGIKVTISKNGADPPKPKNKQSKKDLDFVGFKYGDPKESIDGKDANQAYGISAKERVHMAIFGLPGSGKSSILALLAYQNIVRGEGFMIVDPHGKLVRDIMTMIPEKRHGDVIYVNPASLNKYKKTIKINPLEVRSESERYVVVMSFVSALYNLYKDSWGPRLETVLRNAANALVEAEGKNRLGNMSAMITDQEEREAILEKVSSKTVKHFWEEIFQKQYSKDAGSSAYNKMDKILATPTVAAMFDTIKSSVSIRDIMEQKRILLVDLSTGASDDIAEFLGSIFLNMLYVDAKKRLDVEGVESVQDNRFYVYIDEAHMFSNSTMSEMLRALRKFGVKITLATQTCNAFDQNFAKEIPGICKTLITGRCDQNTAALLKTVMSTSVDLMQRLPSHTFAMFSDEHGIHANAIFRSRHIPFPGKAVTKWEELAAKSVEKWGETVDIEKYMPKSTGSIEFTPLELSILHMLYFDPRDWYREELISRLQFVFPTVLQRNVSYALDRLARDRYIKIRYPTADDGDENETRKRYVLDEKAFAKYFSKAYGTQRAGTEAHMEMIFRIMGNNMNKHRYCVPDLGDKKAEAPDLLIVEPDITEKNGELVYDPMRWSEKSRLAVEVESDPTKHMEHSVYNYTKNIKRGIPVWFVCFSDRHREALEKAIREKHPEFERCQMDVVNVKMMVKRHSEKRGDDPHDDKFYVEKFMDTEDDFFSSVKTRTIREIMKFAESGNTDSRTGNRVDGIKHKMSAKPVSHGKKDEARDRKRSASPTYSDNSGSDHRDGQSGYQKPGKVPDAHYDDTEWAIKEGVKNGTIDVCDIERIRKVVDGTPKVVSDAIKSLINKGVIRKVKYDMKNRRTRTDGTGDQNLTVSVELLELNHEKKDDEQSNNANDDPQRESTTSSNRTDTSE